MARLRDRLVGRRARAQWEAGLVWFRLRYDDPAGPQRALRLLSRPAAGGRVALWFRPHPGPLSILHVGVPAGVARLLQRMAADFAFSLTGPDDDAPPACVRVRPVADLPWAQPFMAHIVDERLFAGVVGDDGRGAFWPAAADAPASAWQLPAAPLVGLALRPVWPSCPVPSALVAAGRAADGWPLGCAPDGSALRATGVVNVSGQPAAVAAWLQPLLRRLLADDPGNLVVIDGAGDPVPQLKRQALVTRLLGDRLRYHDVDGAAVAGGLNPLAPVPGESEDALILRWQRWFGGMGVHPQALALLAPARRSGVADLAGLRRWLVRYERHAAGAAVTGLTLALGRLTRSRTLREWLEWPANPFAALPAQGLLLACRNSGWDRAQVLRALLLAALARPDCRLIVTGVPWSAGDERLLAGQRQLVVGNGPDVAGSTRLLVTAPPAVGAPFLGGNAVMGERLALLGPGEAVVVTDGGPLPVSWQMRSERTAAEVER